MARPSNAVMMMVLVVAVMALLLASSGGSAARLAKPKVRVVEIKNESGKDLIVEPAGLPLPAGKSIEFSNPAQLRSLLLRDPSTGTTWGPFTDLLQSLLSASVNGRVSLSVSVNARIRVGG